MHVTIPESLAGFVQEQVNSGRYPDADAFIAELVRAEAEMFDRIGRGEPIPIDEHFEQRLDALLDAAESSGDGIEITKEELNRMESEALDLVRKRRSC